MTSPTESIVTRSMELSLSGLTSALALTLLEGTRRCRSALRGAIVAPIHRVGCARRIGVHKTTIAATIGFTHAIDLTPAAVITNTQTPA